VSAAAWIVPSSLLGLSLEDRVPDAKTIWLFCQLTQAAAVERLFERFDATLPDARYLATGGQIVMPP
jgi:transposase, IS5 family